MYMHLASGDCRETGDISRFDVNSSAPRSNGPFSSAKVPVVDSHTAND